MERLIVFGGSFDPVHNGHIRIAQAASLALNADVVFVPAAHPRFKETNASPADRLAMLKLAVASSTSGSFYVDPLEIKRNAPEDYSLDTIRELAKKNPKRKLVLLIGADQVNEFPRWHEAATLAQEAEIAFVSRDGIAVDENIVSEFHMTRLTYDKAGPVSSTAVRNLQSIDVPPKVLEYIETHNLYFMKKVASYLSESRFAHSLSVAHLALLIATRNRIINPESAYIAGLLHDIGKGLTEADAREIVKREFPEYAAYPAWSLHQFTGSYLAKKDFGITDEAVLDAIAYHCTGKPHMSPLAKIIYSSDKIEPTRGYDSTKMINKCLKNYYVGFLTVLSENQKFMKEKGYDMNIPLSQACFDLYLGE